MQPVSDGYHWYDVKNSVVLLIGPLFDLPISSLFDAGPGPKKCPEAACPSVSNVESGRPPDFLREIANFSKSLGLEGIRIYCSWNGTFSSSFISWGLSTLGFFCLRAEAGFISGIKSGFGGAFCWGSWPTTSSTWISIITWARAFINRAMLAPTSRTLPLSSAWSPVESRGHSWIWPNFVSLETWFWN